MDGGTVAKGVAGLETVGAGAIVRGFLGVWMAFTFKIKKKYIYIYIKLEKFLNQDNNIFIKFKLILTKEFFSTKFTRCKYIEA